jgi:hypothetical protein
VAAGGELWLSPESVRAVSLGSSLDESKFKDGRLNCPVLLEGLPCDVSSERGEGVEAVDEEIDL